MVERATTEGCVPGRTTRVFRSIFVVTRTVGRVDNAAFWATAKDVDKKATGKSKDRKVYKRHVLSPKVERGKALK